MEGDSDLTSIVLGVIKNSSGKVLIVERAKKEKGRDGSTLSWAFPGGMTEVYETAAQTVERELLEETGFEVWVHEIISQRKHPQFPVLIKYYRCELKSQEQTEVVTDDEIRSSKWVRPEELKNYFTTDLDPGVAKYLGLK